MDHRKGRLVCREPHNTGNALTGDSMSDRLRFFVLASNTQWSRSEEESGTGHRTITRRAV
jgi:hypothetical protein